MYKEIELRITPEEAHDREIVNELLARMLHVGRERIVHMEILRKSIDARQRRVVIQLKVGVHLDRVEQKERVFTPQYRDVSSAGTVVVEKTDSFGEREMRGRAETGSESFVQNRGGE